MIEAPTMSTNRLRWFSGLAATFAILNGTIGFGWIALALSWFENDDGGIHRIHNVVGSGVATGIFVAVPLLILAWRRSDVALLQMVAFAAFAYGVACVLATDWISLLYVPAIAIPAVVLLAVGRGWRSFARAGRGIAPATLAVVIASAAFWATYALEMAGNQRIGSPNDPHVQMHHWTSMTGFAVGVVLLGLLAVLRTPGWRIVAALVGTGSAVFGVASIVFARFPGTTIPYPGGEGAGWGVLALVGGAALVLASWWDIRHEAVPLQRQATGSGT